MLNSFKSLITISHQFLTDRNWWQFHNPKNDVMNMLAESGELAELFIEHEHVTPQTRDAVGQELSDVLFATITFAGNYIDINEIVLNKKSKINIENLTSARQAILSLITQTSKLADLFIWCTQEDSVTQLQKKQQFVEQQLAHVIAHIMLIAELGQFDIAKEFMRKMELNAQKYPVAASSGKLIKHTEIKK